MPQPSPFDQRLRIVAGAERRAVQNDRTLKPAERKAALSVSSMGKVVKDIELRKAIAGERDALPLPKYEF